MFKKIVHQVAALAILFVAFYPLWVGAQQVSNSVQSVSGNSNTTSTTTESYTQAKQVWRNRFEEMKTMTQKERLRVKEEALKQARRFITQAIKRAISRLERMKTTISKIAALESGRKAQLIAQIDAKINELQTLEAKAENVTTKEELVSLVQEVRQKLTQIKSLVKEIVAEILASHIDRTLTKLTTIANTLADKIDDLKDKNYNVTSMEKTLNEAKTLLSQAKEKNEAKNYREARRLAEQARTKLAKLAGEIKSAYANLQGGINEVTE